MQLERVTRNLFDRGRTCNLTAWLSLTEVNRETPELWA